MVFDGHASAVFIFCQSFWKATINYRFVLIQFFNEKKTKEGNVSKICTATCVDFYAKECKVSFFSGSLHGEVDVTT